MAVTMPKLKIIKPSWDVEEEIRDFEQGRYLPFAGEIFVVVEGEIVRSYEDLVRVAGQPRNQGKEFLEIRFLEMVGGG